MKVEIDKDELDILKARAKKWDGIEELFYKTNELIQEGEMEDDEGNQQIIDYLEEN